MFRRALPLLFAGLALAGCTGHTAVTQNVDGGLGYQQADPALRWIAAPDRTSAVTGVSGHLLDGQSFDLSAWRGHVVVVNFWSSDCAPCRDEAQALEQVYRDDKPRGVRFLGVDVRDDSAAAGAFARDHHVTYPSLEDQGGTVGLHFSLGPNATPTTFVLDQQGRIAARHSGSILYTELRDVVRRVLAEPATA